MSASDHDHLVFVREVFLPLAVRRGVAPIPVVDALEEYAWSLDVARPAYAAATATVDLTTTVAAPAAAAVLPPTRSTPLGEKPPGWGLPPSMRTPAPATPSYDRPVPEARAPRPAPIVPPPVREPGRVSTWWSRTKGDIGADLAAHGLAYLGVLLLFVGAFGLVAFSFGDVAEGARPIAEIGIAVTPFLAAWMLLRRGADIAGRALELAGGLLLPVMLITSFLDGVPVPPDLVGVPLVAATTVVAVLVATGYWLWSRAHPASTLRFLVAPVLWLAVGLATMGVGRDIPTGAGVATITAAQVSCMVLAVVASLAWARIDLERPLQRATLTAARVGAVVLAPLALLTWASGGWPWVPVLVTGLAGLVVLEWLDLRAARVIQPIWWAVASWALLASAQTALWVALVGALAAAVFLGLLELAARDTRRLAVALDAAGLALAVVATLADAWVALGVMVALALWAGVRRLHPYAGAAWTAVLDLVAGAAPVGAVVALGAATRDAPLAILVGSGLVLASAAVLDVPRVHAALRRDPSDHYWLVWWDAGMVIAAVAVAVMTGLYVPDVVSAQWMLAGALAVLAVSALLGPLGRAGRPWTAVTLLTWAWLLAAATAGWSAPLVAGVVAGAGLALVVAAAVAPERALLRTSAGALALVGHVLTLVSLVVAAALAPTATTWLATSLLAVATAGLLVTTVEDELACTPLLVGLRRDAQTVARHLLHAVLSITIVVTVLVAAETSGLLDEAAEWQGAILTGLAVLMAATTRLPVSETLRRSATWSAVVWSVLALALLSGLSPMLLGLGAIAVLPLVLAPTARVRPTVWMAWSALAPILGILASQASTAYADLGAAAAASVALVVMGGALLVVALGLDLRGRPWSLHVVPSRRGLVAPAGVGVLEVAAAVVATSTLPWGSDVAGGVALAAAAVAVAAALLTRVWSGLGVAAALVWLGVWQLADVGLLSMPWVGVLATVALLGAAEASHRLPGEGRAWARADLPLLAVAHVTAITSLVTMGTGTSAALVLLAVGVLAVALAVRLHAVVWAAAAYGVIGSVLVVAAGGVAGPGWLALALAAVSVACSVVAMRLTGGARIALVLVGGVTAIGAWLAFASWLDLAPDARAAWTGMIAGAVAVLAAALVRWTSLDRGVLLARGALALVVLTAAPLFGGSASEQTVFDVSVWTGAALALGTFALVLAAGRVHHALRYLAVAYGVAAAFELFAALDAELVDVVTTFEVATVVVVGALLLRVVRDRLGAWLAPVIALGATTSALAVLASVAALPDTRLMSSALAFASLYLVAIGVVLPSFAAVLLSPMVMCAAWMTWVAQAMSPNPQWYTVSLGLTVLVVAELLRRRDGGDPDVRAALGVLDGAGVAFLVGASFVQAFSVSLGYALLMTALGLLVLGWGVLTRVRHRLVMGGLVAVVGVAVLILVPLAQLLPGWSNAVMWTLVACLGLLAIVGATLLERGRAVVRRGMDELARLTEGWD